jgi:hypothetical protein
VSREVFKVFPNEEGQLVGLVAAGAHVPAVRTSPMGQLRVRASRGESKAAAPVQVLRCPLPLLQAGMKLFHSARFGRWPASSSA